MYFGVNCPFNMLHYGYVNVDPVFPQLISMVTLHIMMGSTMRPAPTASCPKTPPSFLTASQRDDTFSSLVRLFFSLHADFSKNTQFWSIF